MYKILKFKDKLLTLGLQRKFYSILSQKIYLWSYGGSILGSSQFTLLPQLPLKTMLSYKVVKFDSKISNSLC